MNNDKPDRNMVNVDACMKCDLCHDVCPMAAANPSFPGPKQMGPDSERWRLMDNTHFDEALRFCLGCRRCETVCPSHVPVTDMIQQARLHHPHRSLSSIIALTDTMGTIATAMAPLTNALMRQPITHSALSLIGLAPERTFPAYASVPFRTYYHQHEEQQQRSFARRVVLFHGCYVNYNNPTLGKEFLHLMNSLNVGVELLRQEQCCGTPMLANGLANAARKHAQYNLRSMRQTTLPILTLSPSCCLTMRTEYNRLTEMDNQDVCSRITLATKWLYEYLSEGTHTLPFTHARPLRVVYHIPCHLQRLGWTCFTIELLKMIPGIELIVPNQQCCGMAGTFGYKKANMPLSDKIASPVITQIEACHPDYVVSDCETCRWQLEHYISHTPILHPISLIHSLL